jgi:hypothetical protein
MTPIFDRYLKQWRLYKTAMIVFIAINVFSLALSVVLAIRYFGFKHNLAIEQNQKLHKIELIDAAFESLSEIEKNAFAVKSAKSIQTTQDEERVLKLLHNWQDLRSLAVELEAPLPETDHPLLLDEKTRLKLIDSRAGLISLRRKLFADIHTSLESYEHNQVELIVTGLLTLIFGLLLPQAALYMMGRALNRVRLEMQNTVREILKSWNETSMAFGPKPFQNVEFWLQILLLAGEQTGRMSGHPMAQIAAEMAYLVRQELRRPPTAA